MGPAGQGEEGDHDEDDVKNQVEGLLNDEDVGGDVIPEGNAVENSEPLPHQSTHEHATDLLSNQGSPSLLAFF